MNILQNQLVWEYKEIGMGEMVNEEPSNRYQSTKTC